MPKVATQNVIGYWCFGCSLLLDPEENPGGAESHMRQTSPSNYEQCGPIIVLWSSVAERIQELEVKLARLESLHKVAADQVTDPSWPEREQEALRWLYNMVGTQTGQGKVAGTILAMLQEHVTYACQEATERVAAQEECEALRSRLSRLRPIVRAAVKWRRPPLHWCGLFADQQLMDAVDALSPEGRAEILEGGE